MTIAVVIVVAMLGIGVGVGIDHALMTSTANAASSTSNTGWFGMSCAQLQSHINSNINASDLTSEATATNLLTIYYHSSCP